MWHSRHVVAVAFLPLETLPFPFNVSGITPTPFNVAAPKPDVRWVTHVAGNLAQTNEPLILVFANEACVHAPAIGFSRRSLRRPAVHYVLVNPAVLPASTSEYSDWPDAPVSLVINTDDESEFADIKWQASLRGWTSTNIPLADFLNAALLASPK